MKFRKKPVVIDANVWTPESCTAKSLADLHGWKIDFVGNVYIPTLEGTMICNVGDWIIRGVKGEYYPCKPDIFEMTYEPVDD